VIHAIAFSDKTELTGRFINTTKGNFLNSLNISCFSFIDVARRAEAADAEGGSADHPDLPGLEPGLAELQRDGRGQGGAGIGDALSGQ
jgi:hypothetical protein